MCVCVCVCKNHIYIYHTYLHTYLHISYHIISYCMQSAHPFSSCGMSHDRPRCPNRDDVPWPQWSVWDLCLTGWELQHDHRMIQAEVCRSPWFHLGHLRSSYAQWLIMLYWVLMIYDYLFMSWKSGIVWKGYALEWRRFPGLPVW